MCICGHTSWEFSIGIIPAFLYSLYIIIAFRRRHVIGQIVGSIAFSLILVMLLKNVADILYLGHDPILR